ncbi:MAG TPA: hypothetical protein DCZ01_11130 [Elusimicrobia bacterium]|nr:hypothetical protein [Elusimicrobiota bacterium]
MVKIRNSGFTLIELMVVVAIIAILAAVIIPHFSDSLRLSTEGYTKGSLGTIRKALSVYYGDMEGQYPDDLPTLTQSSRYLRRIAPARLPGYHSDSSTVLNAADSDDTGGWVYNNIPNTTAFGAIHVNCTHTDAKGSVWTNY